jgi:FMN phosphatase YigB (HAD superfamily)
VTSNSGTLATPPASAQLAASAPAAYACFDVFDTVITRGFARPADLFAEVAARLQRAGLIDGPVEAWVRLRLRAERDLSRAGTATLGSIYAHLGERCRWPTVERGRAMAVEVETELECHRPVPAAAKLIADARAQGRAVVFISDMYLPTSVIRSSLAAAGAWREGDRLYVSGEAGATKVHGKLYARVLADLGVTPAALTHIGDHPEADVAAPSRLGIRAHAFTQARLSRYEEVVADEGRLPTQFRTRLAAAMRLARLANTERGGAAGVIWDVSVDVIGPVLLGYVLWCVAQAKEAGLRRLYFLSRDGQTPFRIARQLPAAVSSGLEFRYLYASRQAWHPAAVTEIDDADCEWLFAQGGSSLTVGAIARRLNFDLHEFLGLLARAGWRRADGDSPLAGSQLTALREALRSPIALAAVRERVNACRAVLSDYLRAEGIADGTPYAVVDVGWNGRLQRSLSRVLAAAGARPAGGTVGLYFGLCRRARAFPDDRLLAYAYDFERDGQHLEGVLTGPLIEQFTEADHGTLTGYAAARGGVTPVLREARNEAALRWGFEHQQQGVARFAQEFMRLREAAGPVEPRHWRDAALVLLAAFSLAPSAEEARVFGAFPKTDTQSHDDARELAPPFTRAEACGTALIGQRRLSRARPFKAMPQSLWPGGSVARSGSALAGRLLRLRHGLLAKAF